MTDAVTLVELTKFSRTLPDHIEQIGSRQLVEVGRLLGNAISFQVGGQEIVAETPL